MCIPMQPLHCVRKDDSRTKKRKFFSIKRVFTFQQMSDQPPTISLCDLPEDVLLHIIGFLEPPYIEVLMRVNQIFNRLAKSGFLWRSITEREYSTHSTRQLLHLFCMLVRLRHEQVWKGASKFVIQSQLDSLHLSDNYQLPDDFDSEYPTPSPLLCKLLLQIARQDGINRWRLFQHFWNHFPQEICNDAIINLINMRMKRTKDLVEACETVRVIYSFKLF